MLTLSIFAPERRLMDKKQVEDVTLTGSEGQIQILPGHAPMMGRLDTGGFEYTLSGGEKTSGVISTGFFEVKDDQVSVVAETIELRSEISVVRAKLAQQKAENALKEAGLDEHHFKKYQLKLQRSLIRQQLAEREKQ